LKNQQTLVEKLQEELHSIRNNQQQLDTVAKVFFLLFSFCF